MNTKLDFAKKMDVLIKILDKNAFTVVMNAKAKYIGEMTAAGNPHRSSYAFENWEIKNCVIASPNATSWSDYIAPGRDHENNVIKECIHALKFGIFGLDMGSK